MMTNLFRRLKSEAAPSIKTVYNYNRSSKVREITIDVGTRIWSKKSFRKVGAPVTHSWSKTISLSPVRKKNRLWNKKQPLSEEEITNWPGNTLNSGCRGTINKNSYYLRKNKSSCCLGVIKISWCLNEIKNSRYLGRNKK